MYGQSNVPHNTTEMKHARKCRHNPKNYNIIASLGKNSIITAINNIIMTVHVVTGVQSTSRRGIEEVSIK